MDHNETDLADGPDDVRPRARRTWLKGLLALTLAGVAAVGIALGAGAWDNVDAHARAETPTTLQRAAKHVPPGHDRYNDPVVCPGGPYRNHGAYVRTHKNDPNAGQSPCGKPMRSVHPKEPGTHGKKKSG